MPTVDEMNTELKSTLNVIVEENKKILEKVEGSSEEQKSHGEMLNTQQTAIEGLKSQIKELETLQARQKLDIQDSKELKGLKSNLEVFNAQQKIRGKAEVSLEEAKNLSALTKDYYSKGYDALTSEQKTLMNTIISPDGGYVVAPEYAQSVVDRQFFDHGVMSLVNMRNIAGNQFIQPVDYAPYDNAEYLNELANGVQGEHEPDYKQVTFNPTEQIYKFRISRNLAEDAMFNVESDVIAKGRLGAGRQTAVQIVIGNGVDRPKGILEYVQDATTGWNIVEGVESNSSLRVTWKDVLGTLPGTLIESYDSNASYAMRKDTFFNQLLTDLDGANQYAIMNQINFFSGRDVSMSILGKPVVFDIALGEASDAGSYTVLYGDFNQGYTLTQRVGFSLIVDNVTSGQFITYRLRRRNDGRLVLGDALKALKTKA